MSSLSSRPETHTSYRKFRNISRLVPKPSHRRRSIIVTAATLLLVVGTLLTRWFILKAIHEQVIEKLKNGQVLFFRPPAFCRVIDNTKEFNIITFPAACLFILILTVITRRVSFQRGKWCWGYVGIPMPIDFFAHVKRVFAAVIFAIFSDELVEIVYTVFSFDGGDSSEGR